VGLTSPRVCSAPLFFPNHTQVLITWVIEEQEFYIHFRASRGFFFDPTFTGQIPLVFWDTNNPTLAAQLQTNPVLCIAYSSQCVHGSASDGRQALAYEWCAQDEPAAPARRQLVGYHPRGQQDLRLLWGGH
jgi:hypothetical protein